MKDECSIDDCQRPRHCRGWCRAHYHRWRRLGDPMPGQQLQDRNPQAKRSFLENAARQVGIEADPCIDWPWAVQSDGYANLRMDGRAWKVSHLVLVASGRLRPPAPGNHALHSCDRPVCIAPYHLRWGTHEENMLEKAQRLRCVGNANKKAKLDPEKVRQIRLRHEHGESRAALAAAYGVSKTTLWSLLHGRTWRHVEAEPA